MDRPSNSRLTSIPGSKAAMRKGRISGDGALACHASCGRRTLESGNRRRRRRASAPRLAAIKHKLGLFQKILRLAEGSLRPRCEE